MHKRFPGLDFVEAINNQSMLHRERLVSLHEVLLCDENNTSLTLAYAPLESFLCQFPNGQVMYIIFSLAGDFPHWMHLSMSCLTRVSFSLQSFILYTRIYYRHASVITY